MKTLLLTLVLASCIASIAEAKVKIVASFSILADLSANVGGDRIELTSIVQPESDAHAYEPKPDDVRAVADADLVVMNGLGFEGWQQRLIEASGFTKTMVTASDGIVPRHSEEHDHADAHTTNDPHAWQDVKNVQIYVANIAKGLCSVDAENCAAYEANAKAYTAKLTDLDASIRASMHAIPPANRIIITSHDAFGYFADAYGITFLAPEGISTDSEASAQDVASLIRQIRNQNAKALFVENISDPRLLQQIASETGLQVGGVLFSDALSLASGPAATYIDMMRHNASTIASAILTQ